MLAAFVVAAGLSLGSCSGAAVSESPAQPSPSGGAPASPAQAMVVTRSGGFAGFHDVIEIAADGSAQVTTRNGGTRGCTPNPAALDALRAIDLSAVGKGPSKIADGFTYEVRAGGAVAQAGDGDNVGIREVFVRAAAAVVSSCLENASGSSYPEK